ncbi:MAG: efflux RND transporter periplasmic adaptor subunit [Gammaproteobacteria bacterium]
MAASRTGKWAGMILLLVIIATGGWFAWQNLREPLLPEGFASGNGRIEATETDIATKLPGRLLEVLVGEGDMVAAGQVLGRMDTKSLEAQLKEAEARVEQARREHDQAAALVRQRKSECALAQKDLKRSRTMYGKDSGIISQEKLDRDVAAAEVAEAMCAAAEAQLAKVEAMINVAIAEVERVRVELDDSVLRTPGNGRVLYKLAEPGEVLSAGGKVLTILDLSDVYMTLFLPARQAGRAAIGAEARIIFDAAPDLVIPASISFVAPRAQFTPKEVETRTEREKLMFRIKVRIAPELLQQHIEKVKTGVPGVAYVRLDETAAWPEFLHVRLPDD